MPDEAEEIPVVNVIVPNLQPPSPLGDSLTVVGNWKLRKRQWLSYPRLKENTVYYLFVIALHWLRCITNITKEEFLEMFKFNQRNHESNGSM